MKICKNCKFFVETFQGVPGGECREFPPEPSIIFPEDLTYPKVAINFTCKSFRHLTQRAADDVL